MSSRRAPRPRVDRADPRRRRNAGGRGLAMDRQERGLGEHSAVQEIDGAVRAQLCGNSHPGRLDRAPWKRPDGSRSWRRARRRLKRCAPTSQVWGRRLWPSSLAGRSERVHNSAPAMDQPRAYPGPVRQAAWLTAACLTAGGLGVALAASDASSGGTKVYRWTDDKGIVHYGDSVPAEYSQKERAVLNGQGVELSAHRGSRARPNRREAQPQQRGRSSARNTIASCWPHTPPPRTSSSCATSGWDQIEARSRPA